MNKKSGTSKDAADKLVSTPGNRVLEAFTFRASDSAFVDMAFGPLTGVALLDSSHPEAADTEMQPAVLVECLSEPSKIPFWFSMNTRE